MISEFTTAPCPRRKSRRCISHMIPEYRFRTCKKDWWDNGKWTATPKTQPLMLIMEQSPAQPSPPTARVRPTRRIVLPEALIILTWEIVPVWMLRVKLQLPVGFILPTFQGSVLPARREALLIFGAEP